MALILVVDPEARYIERVRDALGAEPGFRVSSAEDSARALQVAASTPPDLVLVSVEVEGAEMLLKTFARKSGGKGVLALIPERRSAEAQAFAQRYDAVLVKPFSEQDLRLTVRKTLGSTAAADRAADPANRKLTSADIFGDLLAEFQSEPAPKAGSSERSENAQLRRKLEETVSGVLGKDKKPTPPVQPPSPAPPPKRPRNEEADLDALLSAKLNLDRPRPRPAAPTAVQPATPAPASFSASLTPTPIKATATPAQTPPLAPAGEPRGSLPTSGLATQRIPVLTPAADLASTEPKGPAFGQYVLLEKIAVGGMAEVWKARMRGVEGFQKTVAIKKILPHLTDNSAFVSMFIDEAKLAAQLTHPNITHIYDLGKIGQDYYIAMEFIEGRNLRALLNAARRAGMTFPLGISLLITARLASALDYAHRKKGFDGRELGLVHRDVSPQNILISNDGDIKLCDFGIVKAVVKASHTQMGALKGKLQYMSPEQAWGRQLDGRSDLFALGAIFYEMLVGRRLFPGDNEMSVLEAVRQCRFDPPRLHNPALLPEVEELLSTALAIDPNHRFQTAAAMQQALEGLLYAQRPTPTPADLASFVHLLANAPSAREEAEPISRVSSGSAQPAPIQDFSWEGLAVDDEIAAAEVDLPAVEAKELELPEEMLASAPPPPEVVQQPTAAPRATVLPPSPVITTSSVTAPSVTPRPMAPQSLPVESEEAIAVAPPADGPLDLEEGGSRGKLWLIAAILLLAILGVVGWLTFGRNTPTTSEVPPQDSPAEAQPTTTHEPTQSTDSAIDVETPEGGLAEPAAETPELAATFLPEVPAPSAEDKAELSKLLDQEIAKRENDLKRKLEADQKRLEQQVEEAKAAEEAQRLAEEQAAEQRRLESVRKAAEEADRKAREEDQARQREEEARVAAQPPPEPVKPAVEVGELVRMGPGVVAPKLVSTVKPQYPAAALRLRVEGTVEAEVLVDENGVVRDAKISQPVRQDVGINEAALAAVRSARFRPATKDGVRVKIWTKIIIPFKLADEKGP